MIKIMHRVNTLDQFAVLDPSYGVEMDVHAFGDRLVVQHDAFKDGLDLHEWLLACGNRFVIFNIKEEGIESRVKELAEDASISDYFLLDLSFPALIKQICNDESRIAVRVSEYEMLETALLLEFKVDWVWLDCFKGFPLSRDQVQQLKNSRLKVCMVSPELHGGLRSKNDINNYKNIMNNFQFQADAVKRDV